MIAAALSSFLSPDAADQREAAIGKRLDRLSRQFDRLERDQNILIETMALYVRYFLTVSLPVPEGQQDAARAQGRARYTQFIDQLARHIQRGRSLVREVHDEVFPRHRGHSRVPSLTILRIQKVPSIHPPRPQMTSKPDPLVAEAGGNDLPVDRRIRMLRTAMGPEIAAALVDPEVVEILLNPDGALWLDHLGKGRAPTGVQIRPAVAERIIRLVAAHVRTEVHPGAPILSAELPETGERFLGVLPPVVRAPSFAIRKRALHILTLRHYVADGILTDEQATYLRHAVHARLNIVVAGGTSTGKTTFANALLDEIAETRDRVLILEDTVELQCRSDDHVGMRTEPGVSTMADLVRATLRLRPDRIVVGEVRGSEALDLLKAWAPGIRAASPRSTRAPRAARSRGSSNWSRKSPSRCRAH